MLIPTHGLASLFPPSSKKAIDHVTDLSAIDGLKPQIDPQVRHFIHAGMYARSVTIPPSVRLTGALIKIETILIVSGDCIVYLGEEVYHLCGYYTLKCSAPRKQAFVSRDTTNLTMLFPTTTNDVKKAEQEFTDEWRLLTTRNSEE